MNGRPRNDGNGSGSGSREAVDPPEGESGLELTVHAPRLVPMDAEEHARAVALLAELMAQWHRRRRRERGRRT